MKVRCEGCKDYKIRKRLPDYQVTFNNWCESLQTPCALITNCDYYPDRLKTLPKPKVELKLNEFFNIFAKKPPSSPPPFIK